MVVMRMRKRQRTDFIRLNPDFLKLRRDRLTDRSADTVGDDPAFRLADQIVLGAGVP
jgi:hypothetical protein